VSRALVPLLGILLLATAVGVSIPETLAPIQFEDVTRASRVNFVLRHPATAEKHQTETMVGGVAVLAYNNDDRPDIYFVNGAQQPRLEKSDPSFYNRLY
jgi:hypothetical protein